MKSRIIQHYSKHLVNKGKQPKSVAKFCDKIGISEGEFYQCFASFDAIEKKIFKKFVRNAANLTKEQKLASDDHGREAMLTFYFTLVEVLNANRSLVLMILPKDMISLRKAMNLSWAKKEYLDFANDLPLPNPAGGLADFTNIATKVKDQVLWGQFLSILKFWMDDESKNFERTDMFIEKSLLIGFELTSTKLSESIMDLGKFLMNRS